MVARCCAVTGFEKFDMKGTTMIAFLEKLTRRKIETATQRRSQWSQLVGDVADEKQNDPDAVLTELEQCGRSVDDLQKAVELLRQRREWRKQFDSGAKAEAELMDSQRKIERFIERRDALIEKLDTEDRQLHAEKAAIVNRVHTAADAKRELARTACAGIATLATADLDKQLATAKQELGEVERSLSDKRHFLEVRELEERTRKHGDASVQGEIDQLRIEIKTITKRYNEFGPRFERLHADREAALAATLVPEAI